MPETNTNLHFLKDLMGRIDRVEAWRGSVGTASVPLEPAGRRSAHHEFRGWKHQLEDRDARSVHGEAVRVLAVKGSGGDLGIITREGFALLYLDRLEQLISAVQGRSLRRRDGRFLSALPLSARTRWPRLSILLCMAFCLFRTWTICIRTGPSRWRRAPMAGRRWQNSIDDSAVIWSGCLGRGRVSNLG